MAKELPYFKFEPNQWENGNIQMCSRESKGLFIDLCSTYWSRLGELPYALALQKHCNGSTAELKELESCNLIGVQEGSIIIDFLDEQLNEFQETSNKRRDAANKRWSDASALQVQSKSNAIREDKSRGKKIREDKTTYRAFAHLSISIKEYDKLIEDHSSKDIDDTLDAIENFKGNTKYKSLYLTAKNWIKDKPKAKEVTTKNSLLYIT